MRNKMMRRMGITGARAGGGMFGSMFGDNSLNYYSMSSEIVH
jgi:hypothetical protein